MSEDTPTQNVPALRQAEEPSPPIDSEATPLIEATEFEPSVTDATPALAFESLPAGLSDRDEVTGVVAAARIRLPRSGLEELDTALADLEFALAHLNENERRLLVVVAVAFVSLFLPWFRLWAHGKGMPASPVSGLQVAGASSMLLIIPLGISLLARTATDELLRGHRRLVIRLLTGFLALRLLIALRGGPEGSVPWDYSFWALFPLLVVLGLLLGLVGKLPAWPTRAPLPPR
jgi:hypothetical protein